MLTTCLDKNVLIGTILVNYVPNNLCYASFVHACRHVFMHATPNVIFNSIGKYRSDCPGFSAVLTTGLISSVSSPACKLSINSGLHQLVMSNLSFQQTPPQV